MMEMIMNNKNNFNKQMIEYFVHKDNLAQHGIILLSRYFIYSPHFKFLVFPHLFYFRPSVSILFTRNLSPCTYLQRPKQHDNNEPLNFSYLNLKVQNIIHCVEIHSSRDSTGEPKGVRKFAGSTVEVRLH